MAAEEPGEMNRGGLLDWPPDTVVAAENSIQPAENSTPQFDQNNSPVTSTDDTIKKMSLPPGRESLNAKEGDFSSSNPSQVENYAVPELIIPATQTAPDTSIGLSLNNRLSVPVQMLNPASDRLDVLLEAVPRRTLPSVPEDDVIFLPPTIKESRMDMAEVDVKPEPFDRFVEKPFPPLRAYNEAPSTGINGSKLNENIETINPASGANFRASIFAGSVGAIVSNQHAAKLFEREMNRKSYRQARADDFEKFDPQPPEEHQFRAVYAVSRGELLVAERWRCVRKIAFGGTSIVYLAFSVDYEQEAAVKVCNFSKGDEAIGSEANVYYYIQGGPGIPSLYWYGLDHQRHFLVTELLGPNLLDMLHYCEGKFSLNTVCMIAVQIFETLDWVHRSGYIHRDIRPQNFCLGNGSTAQQIFLVDYATAIKHRPKITVQGRPHIPRVVGTRLKGHAVYDSIAAHYGNEHGYRDDVESALYMLIHFLVGDLPWRGLEFTKKDSDHSAPSDHKALLDRVCMAKLTSSFLESTPAEFQEVYRHIRSLPYEQIPDYELIIHLFLTLMQNEGLTFDHQYDWLQAKECPIYQAQLEKKKQIVRRIVPRKVHPFLALQAHQIQFIEDPPEEKPKTAGGADGQAQEPATQKNGEAALQPPPVRRRTEAEVFDAFSVRDKKD